MTYRITNVDRKVVSPWLECSTICAIVDGILRQEKAAQCNYIIHNRLGDDVTDRFVWSKEEKKVIYTKE